MPPAKKPAARRRTSTARKAARKRPAANEPAAIKRLNKALDGAQDALTALRKDVSREVGAGSRDLHRNLQKFVKEAQRDSGRLSKAIERDFERLQKRLTPSSRTKASKTKRRAGLAPQARRDARPPSGAPTFDRQADSGRATAKRAPDARPPSGRRHWARDRQADYGTLHSQADHRRATARRTTVPKRFGVRARAEGPRGLALAAGRPLNAPPRARRPARTGCPRNPGRRPTAHRDG